MKLHPDGECVLRTLARGGWLRVKGGVRTRVKFSGGRRINTEIMYMLIHGNLIQPVPHRVGAWFDYELTEHGLQESCKMGG